MSKKIIWLRAESKSFERRTPLIPEHAAKLVNQHHTIIVECSNMRIFEDKEYAAVGCELVKTGTWPSAPQDAYILGIKDLPLAETPIRHHHIYFAHAFKGQDGSEQLLNRFKRGNGILYDYEFIRDDKDNQLITCFSYWAGVAGCAVALLLWIQKQQHPDQEFVIPEYYQDENELIEVIKTSLEEINLPDSIVIGANGRCGKGVIDFLNKLKLSATFWGVEDTERTIDHSVILQHHLLFNCVYLIKKCQPFLTKEHLCLKGNLSIIADISCDPNSPNNPLPIYNKITTFQKPTIRVTDISRNVDVMAIDHLPSFLPRESSRDFSNQLLPHLERLLNEGARSPIWVRAKSFYQQFVAVHE